MSDVRVRLTGEVVFHPEKNGLNVEVTLAHVEKKLASVQRDRVAWVNTDFHNSVRFKLTQMMQKGATELAHRLAELSPNSYMEPPKVAPLTQGQVTAVASGLPCPPNPEAPAQPVVEQVPLLPQGAPPARRGPGRPPKVRVQ